jgi:hypothetical protein
MTTIGQFYAGARFNDVINHRPASEGISVAGGPFRDVLFRPSTAAANTSASSAVTFDGGANVNTAAYAGTATDYQWSVEDDQIKVWKKSGSQLFADSLKSVARLRFSDQSLAFDLSGEAGSVARIIAAVFGPSTVENRDYVGIGLNAMSSGMTYEALLDLALHARLGPTYSNEVLVELLFANIVGHSPTAEEASPYLSMLASGELSQLGLAVIASETALNASNADLTGLSVRGLAFH